MPSRCDSGDSFHPLTSDWHPRLLHAVALRLKGGRLQAGRNCATISEWAASSRLAHFLAPSSPTLLPRGGEGGEYVAEIDPPLAKKTFWRAGTVGWPVGGRRLVARCGGAKRDSAWADHRFDQ
jgi:hypothetical protein